MELKQTATNHHAFGCMKQEAADDEDEDEEDEDEDEEEEEE